MKQTQGDLIGVLAGDKDKILYYPRLRKITGSVLSAILFQQMIYWWNHVGRVPFYKFAAPCGHTKYKEGDSWQEELGFSRTELATALSKIGTKITTGVSKNEALKTSMIVYWTDRNRVTWYELNTELINQKLAEMYGLLDYLSNAGNQHYIENDGTLQNMESQEPGDRFPSDTTTETTTDIKESAPAPPTRNPAYLPSADVQAGLLLGTQQAGVADPSQDDERWFAHRDAFLAVYRQHTGLYPDAQVGRPAIAALALENNADPEFWGEVIKAWKLCGWNPRNIAGMIECYGRRELPGKRGKPGGSQPASASNDAWMAEDWSELAEEPAFIGGA